MHKLSRAAILALHAVYSREPRGTANYPVSPLQLTPVVARETATRNTGPSITRRHGRHCFEFPIATLTVHERDRA